MDLDKECGDDGVDGIDEGEACLDGVGVDLRESMVPGVGCAMMSRNSVWRSSRNLPIQ